MSKSNVSQALKDSLLEACNNYVTRRIANATQAIESASEASTNDTKSSAGDKFETTREMMQQELNRHQQLLVEAQRMAKALADLDIRIHSGPIKPGSLVGTNNGMFFISISAGELQIAGTAYRAISPASPVGQRFIGLKTGDEFTFNDTNYRITNVD